jgi:hypothetical protein
LRHRSGRHVKCQGRALKAAFSNDGCQGGQLPSSTGTGMLGAP